MAAKKGNQYWLKRSKHGRDTLFKEPILLKEAFLEWIEHVDSHPWFKYEKITPRKIETINKRTGKVTTKYENFEKVPVQQPYLWESLCIWLQCSVSYFTGFKAQMAKGLHQDFSEVIGWIDNVMNSQKVSGAALGFFKENIIQNYMGMAQKVEAHNTNINLNSAPLQSDQIKDIAKALEDEC